MIWMGWAIFPPPQSLVELRPDCKRSFRLRVSAHEADGSIEQLATMPSPVLRQRRSQTEICMNGALAWLMNMRLIAFVVYNSCFVA
jgi:hypothetical protein